MLSTINPRFSEEQGQLLADLFRHHFTLSRIERIGRVRGSRFTDRGAQIRLNQHFDIVRAYFLINIGGQSPRFRLKMSDVSRFITRPSLEGTLADSLTSCVRMDISWLTLKGLTR